MKKHHFIHVHHMVKITRAVANIYLGYQDVIIIGNLDAKRDWGHARDYVYGMWLMLQQDKPDDYVLSTNETHTVREFIEKAFKVINVDIIWEGKGINEIGKDKATGITRIKVNEKYFRPTEVDILLGDSTKARKILKWKPSVTFD
eukprot:jgi/Orpsp1_1/1175078/evm.model.c7180000052535.2